MNDIVEALKKGISSFVKIDKDKANIDTFVAKLHHKISYSILFFGVLGSLASSFLFSQQIVCKEYKDYKDDYNKNFCLIHGAEHVKDTTGNVVAGGTKCWDGATDNMDTSYKKFRNDVYGNRRPTDYYIWLPYFLIICMGLSQMGRFLWKVLEGGVMKDIKEDGLMAGTIFEKLRNKINGGLDGVTIYFLKYWCIEVLNLILLSISIHMMDSLLHNLFLHYWPDISSFSYGADEDGEPKCRLFPTEVDCKVSTIAVTGSDESASHICTLPANLYNQWFFLILWFWWVILFTLSVFSVFSLAILYFLPSSFGKMILSLQLRLRGITVDDLELNSSEYFFIGFAAQNMGRLELTKFIREASGFSQIEKEKDGEPLINGHHETIQMEDREIKEDNL